MQYNKVKISYEGPITDDLQSTIDSEITLDRAIVIGVRGNKELDLYPIGITFDDLQNIFVFISDLLKK